MCRIQIWFYHYLVFAYNIRPSLMKFLFWRKKQGQKTSSSKIKDNEGFDYPSQTIAQKLHQINAPCHIAMTWMFHVILQCHQCPMPYCNDIEEIKYHVAFMKTCCALYGEKQNCVSNCLCTVHICDVLLRTLDQSGVCFEAK